MTRGWRLHAHARLFHRRRPDDLALAALMLLAWEVVAVQFEYIGLGLWERFGKTDLLMSALVGAINIPFYERDGAPNSLVVAIQRPGFRRSGSQADVLFALTEVQFPH